MSSCPSPQWLPVLEERRRMIGSDGKGEECKGWLSLWGD